MSSPPSRADVFRCVTPAGAILYTDAPCPAGARAEDITARVGECDDAACIAEREARAATARERLSEQKALLTTLTEQRLRMAARAAEERMRMEALRALLPAAPPGDEGSLSAPVYPWWSAPASRCHRCQRPHPPSAHKPDQPPERTLSFRDFDTRAR